MNRALAASASRIFDWLDQRRFAALAVILPLVTVIHLLAAAFTIRHSNQDSRASDQGAEMWLAATSREDVFPQRTDGVRHPLWSWLARFGYTEDQARFFARGKWLNTCLCVAFLWGLGIVSARWLDPLATLNLLLLCSLGILLVRGTYFQPEPLYYILSFLAALLAWRLLAGAGPGLYALFGVACGLAWLAKPSLTPLLLVFGAAFALRLALGFVSPRAMWTAARSIFGLVVAAVIAGLLLAPLALFSAKHFGRPMFNYTGYWMWMDDFDTEAWPFQDRYPGRDQLEKLPAAGTPSAGWYFARHSASDALKRLAGGAAEVTVRFLFPEPKLAPRAFFWRAPGKKWEQPLAHRGAYLIALGLLATGLAVAARQSVFDRLREPENLARLAFILMSAGIYTLLYGWYWPIGRGDRFMGSLWIPAVFLLIWAGMKLRALAARPGANAAWVIVHSVILLSLLLQVCGMFWQFHSGFPLATRN